MVALPKKTKKLEEDVITEIAGADTLTVVDYLRDKEHVSEFIIAEDLKIEINLIRNMLYRLLNANLVSFYRKKDKQKGWYIYYWAFNANEIMHRFWELKKSKLDRLKTRLDREKGTIFYSYKGVVRCDFEQATAFQFRCPETGEIMEQEDNSTIIKDLEKDIKDLQQLVDAYEKDRSSR